MKKPIIRRKRQDLAATAPMANQIQPALTLSAPLSYAATAANIAFAVWLWRYGIHHHAITIAFPVQKDVPWWSQIGPEVTALGGLIALWTYLGNKRQQKHQFEISTKQQREHFDRQELQAQFKDILDRFADADSPLMRSSAVHRLNEIAKRPLPGLTRLDEERLGPQLVYPMFEPASAHLVAALHLEESNEVRGQVRVALTSLTYFASGSHRQELLKAMIAQLRVANQSASNSFGRALAACSIRTSPENLLSSWSESEIDDLESWMSPMAGLCRNNEDTFSFVERTMGLKIYERAVLCRNLSEPSATNMTNSDRLIAFNGLSQATDHLVGVIEILSVALCQRNFDDSEYVELDTCWLPSAKLKNAVLPHSRLSLIPFHSADLQGADLTHAFLYRCDFHGANLSNVVAMHSNFGMSKFLRTALVGADLRHANLQGCNFQQLSMANADLRKANLEGATMFDVYLRDTKLAGARVDESTLIKSNWWLADFREEGTGVIDHILVNWLQNQHPKPDDVTIPYCS